MTILRISEIEGMLKGYESVKEQFLESRRVVYEYFSALNYELLENVSGYSGSLMISPELFNHPDWAQYTYYLGEDEGWFIDDLQVLPLELGDNDWNTGFHIIEL